MLRKINRPTFSVKDIVTACAMDYKELSKQNKYLDEIDKLSIEENNLNRSLSSRTLYSFSPTSISLNKNDMENLYSYKFVNSRVGNYYNNIMTLPDHQKCPLCFLDFVSEIEHYYPKSIFHIHSLTPINLYPVCHTCNTKKKKLYGTTINRMFVNPYIEDFNNTNWLKGNMIYTGHKLKFNYYVDLSNTYYERINYIFKQLELDVRYTKVSNFLLFEKQIMYKKILLKTDSNQLKEIIQKSYDDLNFNNNYYKKIFYKSILDNFNDFIHYIGSS